MLMQLTDVAEPGRLEPINAAIAAGEIVHLVGPNGAGKSTLLARMADLARGTALAAWGLPLRQLQKLPSVSSCSFRASCTASFWPSIRWAES